MSDGQNVSKQLGNSLGHRWRTELATHEQATNLCILWETLTDQASNAWDSWFANRRSGYTPGERLFFMISPWHLRDRVAAQEFWSEFGDHANPADNDFILGFAEGALGLDAKGEVPGDLLREVVLAALEFECPTVEDIVKATGICEDSAARMLHAAETFGLLRNKQPQ